MEVADTVTLGVICVDLGIYGLGPNIPVGLAAASIYMSQILKNKITLIWKQRHGIDQNFYLEDMVVRQKWTACKFWMKSAIPVVGPTLIFIQLVKTNYNPLN